MGGVSTISRQSETAGRIPEAWDAEQERACITRVQNGDREAFTCLMQRYHRRVFAFLYRMLGDYSLADDAAQETFIRAYRNITSFRFEARFSTWL